ncbi:MAG: hypothetical protein E6Q69_13830 [Aquipseudomonas alcaligenes]|uniref:Uncharacterized protein n=1 Tax=Aquipseudomonas alcaligenes TaxID=43263 RepID=A0A5C7VZS1_AQUAC|nr:MAG: hypothetical protein E6Q69_13830 [Pseudomonas alcaligenes]
MRAAELIDLLRQYDPDTDIPVAYTDADFGGQPGVQVASCYSTGDTRCYQNLVEQAQEGLDEDDEHERPDIGWRGKMLVDGTDLDFYLFDGLSPDPLYVVEEGQMVEQQRRRSLVGASFARPAGDWVVRGDLVHLFNEPLQTPEGAENVPKSAALLGLDLTRNEWTVNLQATVSHRHGAPDSLPRETGWEASAAVLKDWSKQRLNAGILWLYNREVQSSHMVKANLGYRPWNQWYLETGYIAFSGGQTTQYGQFDNRDRLYLQVRRDFSL